jgi:hypothetical protein
MVSLGSHDFGITSRHKGNSVLERLLIRNDRHARRAAWAREQIGSKSDDALFASHAALVWPFRSGTTRLAKPE